MDFKKLTEDKLLAARLYMPLAQKMAFVDEAARSCLDSVTISLSTGGEIEHTKEATDRKSRYLMGALVGYYFNDTGFAPVSDTTYLMAQDDYDRWAGGHIFNQLERFKSNSKTRDIAFDLLWDYRDLEKRLNTEVYNLLQAMNDPIATLERRIALAATPEAVQKTMGELQGLREALGEYEQKTAEKGDEE